MSASKIVKKYRLSSSRRQSQLKGIVSDESLVNYDTFEVSVLFIIKSIAVVIFAVVQAIAAIVFVIIFFPLFIKAKWRSIFNEMMEFFRIILKRHKSPIHRLSGNKRNCMIVKMFEFAVKRYQLQKHQQKIITIGQSHHWNHPIWAHYKQQILSIWFKYWQNVFH